MVVGRIKQVVAFKSKVKYTGNSLGGFETVVQGKWSFKRSGR